jgi:hypothetical protein
MKASEVGPSPAIINNPDSQPPVTSNDSTAQRVNRLGEETITRYSVVGATAGTVIAGPIGTIPGLVIGAAVGGVKFYYDQFTS